MPCTDGAVRITRLEGCDSVASVWPGEVAGVFGTGQSSFPIYLPEKRPENGAADLRSPCSALEPVSLRLSVPRERYSLRVAGEFEDRLLRRSHRATNLDGTGDLERWRSEAEMPTNYVTQLNQCGSPRLRPPPEKVPEAPADLGATGHAFWERIWSSSDCSPAADYEAVAAAARLMDDQEIARCRATRTADPRDCAS